MRERNRERVTVRLRYRQRYREEVFVRTGRWPDREENLEMPPFEDLSAAARRAWLDLKPVSSGFYGAYDLTSAPHPTDGRRYFGRAGKELFADGPPEGPDGWNALLGRFGREAKEGVEEPCPKP